MREDASRFTDAFWFIPNPATIDAVLVAVNEALLAVVPDAPSRPMDCRSRRSMRRSERAHAMIVRTIDR